AGPTRWTRCWTMRAVPVHRPSATPWSVSGEATPDTSRTRTASSGRWPSRRGRWGSSWSPDDLGGTGTTSAGWESGAVPGGGHQVDGRGQVRDERRRVVLGHRGRHRHLDGRLTTVGG